MKFKVTIHGQGAPKSIEIDKDSCILGRGKDCDIVLDTDLVSRKHLKITMDKGNLFVEEMGSSNGSWFNSDRIELGEKIPYSSTDVIHLGKMNAGISITLDRVVLKMVSEKTSIAAINTDNEKTLVYKITPQIQTEIETPTLLVANGSPVNLQVNKPVIKLVESETHSHTMPSRSGSGSDDHKHGLENKVKNLINQESEKLREIALKQSNEILQKAHTEEKAIVHRAQKEAQDIIQQAKLESERYKQEASASIMALQEKAKSTQAETEEIVKSYKQTAHKIESNIQSLKKDEGQFLQKIKFLEDNVSSIQEKIRNENTLLDDIKTQASNLRKTADLKFEEIVMEERRARARIETEIVEAKTQTAKVFAEAEKIQASKEMMESEISQLKTDRSQIEKDINELQISCRRHEYDFEKLTREYNALLEENSEAQISYDNLLNEARGLSDKFQERQEALLQEERALQETIDGLTQSAELIISNAKSEANKIIEQAQIKSTLMAEKVLSEQKELDAHKAAFYINFEIEKKNKFQELATDIEKQKALYQVEIKKLEQKKENTFNETKWLEESAQKKCEKIVAQGHADAEALKAVLEKEAERKSAALDLEFQTMKSQLLKEHDILKSNAHAEILAAKERANAEIFQAKKNTEHEIAHKLEDINAHAAKMKIKADNFIEQEKEKWEIKHAKLKEEIATAESVTRRHEAALLKTEALKDDNFIQANLKIQSMMADAAKDVAEMQKESAMEKAKEQNALLDMRRVELEKIEELKAKFEQYKIDNRKDIAEHTSLAVQEFLINDMIKSRNLILNEGLIKKLGERARKLVVEANLGRIHPSEKGSKAFPKRDYRKLFRWMLRLSILAMIVATGFYAYENYTKEFQMLESDVKALIKAQNIKIPDQLPTKNQIIDFLR